MLLAEWFKNEANLVFAFRTTTENEPMSETIDMIPNIVIILRQTQGLP
jgi:hypothetical protein